MQGNHTIAVEETLAADEAPAVAHGAANGTAPPTAEELAATRAADNEAPALAPPVSEEEAWEALDPHEQLNFILERVHHSRWFEDAYLQVLIAHCTNSITWAQISSRFKQIGGNAWHLDNIAKDIRAAAKQTRRAQAAANGTAPGPDQADWRHALTCSKGGEPKETFPNAVLALQHLAPWHKACWYDSVREIAMCDQERLTEAKVGQAAIALERQAGIPIRSLKNVHAALMYHCQATPRDLLHEWLDALPAWDRAPRLDTWLQDCAGLTNTAYHRNVSRLLPVSMVARARNPGCQYRNVVVLEGPEDLGKSKLVKALASVEWYRELSHSMDGKEAHMILQGAWVVELAELSSYSKTEENRWKSYITMERDDYIPKYANAPVSHLRRTLFIGTHNPEGDNTWMRGQTGNTRYLPIACTTIDPAKLTDHREQLFAEAQQYYCDHPADWWQLSSDGQAGATEAREARRQASVYEDTLRPWLTNRPRVHWHDIAEHYLKLEAKEKWKDKALQMEVAKAMRALKWTNKPYALDKAAQAETGKSTARAWFPPPGPVPPPRYCPGCSRELLDTDTGTSAWIARALAWVCPFCQHTAPSQEGAA